jgi:Tfp pilus assembly protein PilN
MRALALDFIPRRNVARFVAAMLCAFGLISAACLAYAYRGLQAEVVAAQARLQVLQRKYPVRATVAPPRKDELAGLQDELKRARQVIDRLSLPWDSLFRELEASVDVQVTLLGLEPDTEKNKLQITAEASSLGAMTAYVRRLRDLPSFQEAYVVSHQVQAPDPQKPVRFVVSAQWRIVPAVPFAPTAVEPAMTMFGREN